MIYSVWIDEWIDDSLILVSVWKATKKKKKKESNSSRTITTPIKATTTTTIKIII